MIIILSETDCKIHLQLAP